MGSSLSTSGRKSSPSSSLRESLLSTLMRDPPCTPRRRSQPSTLLGPPCISHNTLISCGAAVIFYIRALLSSTETLFPLLCYLTLCEENRGSWRREGDGPFTASSGIVPRVEDNRYRVVFPVLSPSSTMLKNGILEKAYLAINKSVRRKGFLQWCGRLSSWKICESEKWK
ncbi:hypothetical protein Fot_22091 [Forsythia ovata]|uniref:Uncharacterized protein n=1 Tax=Forsythia ovata TaxID=205694 RepID=A0ABD1UYD3_9LAMI